MKEETLEKIHQLLQKIQNVEFTCGEWRLADPDGEFCTYEECLEVAEKAKAALMDYLKTVITD